MRYLGIAAECLSLVLVGMYVKYFCSKRYSKLERLSEFFDEFSRVPFLTGFDAAEFIKELYGDGRFSELDFISVFASFFTCGTDLPSAWQTSVKSSDEYVFLGKAARERLLNFSQLFGRTGKEEFRQKCLEYSLMFSHFAENEKSRNEKTVSVFMGLSMFAAAAVFIILI